MSRRSIGKLYSDLLNAYKEGTFESLGLPPGRSLISASAVPHRGVIDGKDFYCQHEIIENRMKTDLNL